MILSPVKRLCNNRMKKCIYKSNKRGGAYSAYNSSKEVENAVPVVSGVEENGHVSSAFWCIYGSNSVSTLNKTSIFQRSLSPKTRRCDSTDPSTPERGGQRCNIREIQEKRYYKARMKEPSLTSKKL